MKTAMKMKSCAAKSKICSLRLRTIVLWNSPPPTELASLIVERNSKLEDGEQFAHYRIVSQIGAGGMGEVYLAKGYALAPQSRSQSSARTI
ncbi:MAG: hypothetical protein WKF71_11395 [Pyrinomonadaceae bacterium]